MILKTQELGMTIAYSSNTNEYSIVTAQRINLELAVILAGNSYRKILKTGVVAWYHKIKTVNRSAESARDYVLLVRNNIKTHNAMIKRNKDIELPDVKIAKTLIDLHDFLRKNNKSQAFKYKLELQERFNIEL